MDPEEAPAAYFRNVLQAGLELEGVVDCIERTYKPTTGSLLSPPRNGRSDHLGDGDPRKAKLLGAFLVSLQEHQLQHKSHSW